MKRNLLFSLMMVVSTAISVAQVTTSSIVGIITDDKGALPGATIVAIHLPSGTHTVHHQTLMAGTPYQV